MFLSDGWQREMARKVVEVTSDPLALYDLGAPIDVVWSRKVRATPRFQRDAARAALFIRRTITQAMKMRGAKRKRELLRRLEPFLPSVTVPVSFSVYPEYKVPGGAVVMAGTGDTIKHHVQWQDAENPAPKAVAALALACLLGANGKLLRNVRVCPECDRYFWKDGKRQYCSAGCSAEVHRRQVIQWKARNG
jgi:hypothetical protein